MPLETSTDVEQLRRVQDSEGNIRAPATERAARTTFPHGDAESSSAGYPFGFNPDGTIYELLILESGADIVVTITTTAGDSFSFTLNGISGSFNRWEIESVEFSDPNNTGATTRAAWAGQR